MEEYSENIKFFFESVLWPNYPLSKFNSVELLDKYIAVIAVREGNATVDSVVILEDELVRDTLDYLLKNGKLINEKRTKEVYKEIFL